MAGRTPNEAVRAFAEPIQRALACFAHGRVSADVREPGPIGTLTFNRNEDVLLNGGGGVQIATALKYLIVPTGEAVASRRWKVSTTGWIHDVKIAGEPIVEFHWHPELDPSIPMPHLHTPERKPRRHYPTGRVLIEDVLNFAVECGARPYDPLAWEHVFKVNVDNFKLGASWGVSHPREPATAVAALSSRLRQKVKRRR